ncbi:MULTISPECIES: LysM peptidoglycan-binding domain-containing protein [unclassified Kribbella]|uniref:LysM peptidoglycan-binding domain-containing protein n=1 Tax=unclassified Kribbella TaxID=2644121 RepID=UPI0033E28DDD
MIRGLKGLLALATLAALGLALRWITAGSYGAATSHDLDSLTVLAVATVAWIAYAWLALAVTTTALEQLPGVLGAAASALAALITTRTARTLLRTTLGLAAATPLTLTTAHATPADAPINRPWTEPRSTLQPTTEHPPTNEPRSTLLTGTTPNASTWRTTEPPSTVRLTGSALSTTHTQAARPQDVVPRDAHAPHDLRRDGRTEGVVPLEPRRPAPQPQTAAPDPNPSAKRTGTNTGAPADSLPQPGAAANSRSQAGAPADSQPQTGGPAEARGRRGVAGDGRVRVGVPDRPTAGAAVRYTDVRSGQPVRVPRRVVVKPGDTLWSIAATELGPQATPQDIASRWPAWYAANRQLIGPDPDLIRPGQVLRIPPPATGNPVPPTHQEK